MTIGIDKIDFATSPYVLRLEDLAAARDTDPRETEQGSSKNKVCTHHRRHVTLAATAADDIFNRRR